jgi:hypothetical protein
MQVLEGAAVPPDGRPRCAENDDVRGSHRAS